MTTSNERDGRIFITGGTGFVGGALRKALAGYPLRLLVRDRQHHQHLESDRIELVEGDVTDAGSLRNAMDNCTAVIHLVAIIEESGNTTFDQVIRQGTERVVNEAREARVNRFMYMSALGSINQPEFPYHQAKWRAEEAVKASGLDWTIFRPSVIFGAGDGFINALAGVVRSFPIIPVVGDGRSRFQPVSVADVAAAYKRAVDDSATIGKSYDLGGTEIYTYEELLDLIGRELGTRKPKIHLPVSLMKLVVTATRPLPRKLRPPVSKEQLKMLAIDNSTAHSATEELIGHPPLSLEQGIGYIGH